MRTALLLLSLLAWTAQSERPAEDPTQLMEADRAFYADTRDRGLEGWLGWFAPDAAVLTVDGRMVTGADDLRAYYASLRFPPPGFSWSPERAELAASADLGFTTGTWELRSPGAPEGAEVPGGPYLSVWARQPDGSYRVLVDSGGEPDFRTRLDELDGPPLEWSSTTDRFESAESGELAIALGTWTARTEDSELIGRFLTVWKRTSEATWEIAAEIGFAY